MRTPSESSISLTFSSRVPKRGSRFGVISRAAFRGPPWQPARQATVEGWIVRVNEWAGSQEAYRSAVHRGRSAAGSDWRWRPIPVSEQRVALPGACVNPTRANIHKPIHSLGTWPRRCLKPPRPEARGSHGRQALTGCRVSRKLGNCEGCGSSCIQPRITFP